MAESSHQPHPDGPSTKSPFVGRRREMQALNAVPDDLHLSDPGNLPELFDHVGQSGRSGDATDVNIVVGVIFL